MGITLSDIAAQRAMLKRGEEKRKADWKLAERERLRDTFAAAALTGLLSNHYFSLGDEAAKRCYGYADAMLRERAELYERSDGKRVFSDTNHDAVPEARARDADRGRTDKAVTRPGDGTGNTHAFSGAEREAIAQVLDDMSGKASAESWVPDILRNLLERTT